MIEPKSQIYTILKKVTNNVYQAMPEVNVVYPCIIYSISGNEPQYTVDQELEYQIVEAKIDIYDKTSKGTGTLLVILVNEMLDNGYRMTYCADIPNEDSSHISTLFSTII